MVFLTAGMGGGTGTGAIPIVAEIARSLGAVTIAIVTTPFSFEMGRRQRNANTGLAELAKHTDTLISIPNDRLLMVAPRDLPLEVAFRLADDVLRQAVQGITELITEPGMINVDFAHVRRLMKIGGGAFMPSGMAKASARLTMPLSKHWTTPYWKKFPSTRLLALSLILPVAKISHCTKSAKYSTNCMPVLETRLKSFSAYHRMNA